MKALGLVRISKNKFSSNFGCNNLGGKQRESFSIKFFASIFFSGEHFNSCKNVHGRLKSCEIFSYIQFMRGKSKSTIFMNAASA